MPGLLSLPLNLVVVVAAVRDQVKKKKVVAVRAFEAIAALFALLYVLLSTVWSAAETYSMGCAGKTTQVCARVTSTRIDI